MHFRKPELVPLVFIIFSVVILSGLGFWQLERLQWKQGLIAGIEKGQAMPVLGTLPQETEGLEYRNVRLYGTFLHEKSLHLVGHPQDMGPGFFILTPFKLEDDGRIILVNRGFSPQGRESKPEGPQTVSGIIRPRRQQRTFSPANSPDKNVWFYEDIAAMSQTTGLELTPLIVESVGKQDRNVFPMPSDGKIALRNEHLNYAITWFSLAIIAVVMFGFYQREPVKKA